MNIFEIKPFQRQADWEECSIRENAQFGRTPDSKGYSISEEHSNTRFSAYLSLSLPIAKPSMAPSVGPTETTRGDNWRIHERCWLRYSIRCSDVHFTIHTRTPLSSLSSPESHANGITADHCVIWQILHHKLSPITLLKFAISWLRSRCDLVNSYQSRVSFGKLAEETSSEELAGVQQNFSHTGLWERNFETSRRTSRERLPHRTPIQNFFPKESFGKLAEDSLR